MSELLKETLGTLRDSIDDIALRVTEVRYAPLTAGVRFERIQFRFDGDLHQGELRGRNADLVLTGNRELDQRIAVRLILDGCSTVPTNTTQW